jgi:hypothetical protein
MCIPKIYEPIRLHESRELALEALSGYGCNWLYGFAVNENSEDLRVVATFGREARDFIAGSGLRRQPEMTP